jgi:hypothetical protein
LARLAHHACAPVGQDLVHEWNPTAGRVRRTG